MTAVPGSRFVPLGAGMAAVLCSAVLVYVSADSGDNWTSIVREGEWTLFQRTPAERAPGDDAPQSQTKTCEAGKTVG